MNYAQEGLEANEVDNSLTLTNAALSAELDAHSNTAILLENALTREQILKERCDSLTLEQATAAKLLAESKMLLNAANAALVEQKQVLAEIFEPLMGFITERLLNSHEFEKAVANIIEDAIGDITDSSHFALYNMFARIVDDMIEDRISNLDFEVRVR